MTRQELEARRLSAIPYLSNGTPTGKLAKQFRVSRVTIYRWKKMLSQGETKLKSRKAPGRPSRINDAERAAIKKLYSRQNGWTQRLFGNAMSDELGIEYSVDHVGRIMHRLGLVPERKVQP